MTYNLEKNLERQIISLAEKFGVEKIFLFGSRARGTNSERSDIDLAIIGGDYLSFALAVDEETDTLLKFDVVNLDKKISPELADEIFRDGVLIYEKV